MFPDRVGRERRRGSIGGNLAGSRLLDALREGGNPWPSTTKAALARNSVARRLVDQARDAADNDEADRLVTDAARIDPTAVDDAPASTPDPVDSDEEVRLVTATVEPHSDAPSRAGITAEGSGADGM